MPRKLFYLLLTFAIFSSVFGLGIDVAPDEEEIDDSSPDGRFIIPVFLGSGSSGFNITQIAALAALAASALLPLLGLAAVACMCIALLAQHKDMGMMSGYGNTGYGGGGGGGHSSSYSSSYRALESIDKDWEELTILDWLEVAQEAYEKYNPVEIECQKRVVCELHQNEKSFGPAATSIVKYFSYLRYASVFSLPEEIKTFSEDMLEAAEVGQSMKKDCGTIFNNCDFSVKKIMEKYGHVNYTDFPDNDENKDNAI